MEGMYCIAGIDVHKKMLAVVVADVAREGEFQFEKRKFGTADSDVRSLAAWLQEQGVREVVMESTPILAAGVAGTGRTLEAIPGAGLFESGAAWPQARFRRCRTPLAAAGGRGTDAELRTRS